MVGVYGNDKGGTPLDSGLRQNDGVFFSAFSVFLNPNYPNESFNRPIFVPFFLFVPFVILRMDILRLIAGQRLLDPPGYLSD